MYIYKSHIFSGDICESLRINFGEPMPFLTLFDATP